MSELTRGGGPPVTCAGYSGPVSGGDPLFRLPSTNKRVLRACTPRQYNSVPLGNGHEYRHANVSDSDTILQLVYNRQWSFPLHTAA